LISLIVTSIFFGTAVFDYPLLLNNTRLTPSKQEVFIEAKFCKFTMELG
jgi:hypothetical protein